MTGKEDGQRMFWIVPVLLLTMVLFTPQADAWRGDHDNDRWHGNYRNHGHRDHPYGNSVFSLHGKYFTLTVGGGRYYYCDGRFYRRRHWDYVVVREPIGVVIPAIPVGCHKVIIDGRIYYNYNDVYYLQTAGGYRVVEAPSTVVLQPDVVSDDNINVVSDTGSGSAFTVNIPNSKGGYTAITLKRSGTGFIGPQGEFYPEFPKVEQLRAMYAK